MGQPSAGIPGTVGIVPTIQAGGPHMELPDPPRALSAIDPVVLVMHDLGRGEAKDLFAKFLDAPAPIAVDPIAAIGLVHGAQFGEQ